MSVVGKIYIGIFLDRFRRGTEDLIDDEQRGFRSGRGCIDQIFSLDRQVSKHLRKK